MINLFDFRLDRIFNIGHTVFEIRNDDPLSNLNRVTLENGRKIDPEIHPEGDGFIHLKPGYYKAEYNYYLELGFDEIGRVIGNNELYNNGVSLTSGVYIPGHHHSLEALLHVMNGRMKIKPGVAIGKFIITTDDRDGEYY